MSCVFFFPAAVPPKFSTDPFSVRPPHSSSCSCPHFCCTKLSASIVNSSSSQFSGKRIQCQQQARSFRIGWKLPTLCCGASQSLFWQPAKRLGARSPTVVPFSFTVIVPDCSALIHFTFTIPFRSIFSLPTSSTTLPMIQILQLLSATAPRLFFWPFWLPPVGLSASLAINYRFPSVVPHLLSFRLVSPLLLPFRRQFPTSTALFSLFPFSTCLALL